MGISISIVAGQDQAASSVNASGSVQHVITDEERTTFKLGDKQLKDAVNKYFGKSPNDAYLHSPTPWGDLYKKYNWPQVQMVLVVQSAEILGITSEPVIVKTQDFTNNSSIKGTFNVAISESLNNTTSSNWSTGGTLTIGQKFSYGVKFLGAGAEGETSLSYSQSWGVGGQESKSITVGSTSGVSVELDPGESVVAELSASRGVMKVRIRYNAYLIGNTAVNYNPTYKKHHFWSLGIGGVMSKGGVSNSVQSTEDIEIGYYSNSKIELKNKISGKIKASHALADATAGELTLA
ncbi:follicular epithelium yolk protein subunit [Aquimarina latercula]|uniref:follicular epithelium yolk protein subunit n=1 Tax=Aquimarina latercula TaxID=987 RepID=UPI0004224F57|nr:follicular epithelium yolk protein subunit [Aquimarina latercula]